MIELTKGEAREALVALSAHKYALATAKDAALAAGDHDEFLEVERRQALAERAFGRISRGREPDDPWAAGASRSLTRMAFMGWFLVIAAVVLFAGSAWAQAPEFCHAQDPGNPHYDINDYDAQRDADDWCKLAHNEPHKARRQLAKAVALVRGENNPNRFYFDPKMGSAPGLYVQLLRDWMKDANGRSLWKVVQWQHRGSNFRGFATSLTWRFVIVPVDAADADTRITVALAGAGYDSVPIGQFYPPDIQLDGFQGLVPDLPTTAAPTQVGFSAVSVWASCNGPSQYISATRSYSGLSAALVKAFIEGVLDQPQELGCEGVAQ